jgi:hypothetical protein
MREISIKEVYISYGISFGTGIAKYSRSSNEKKK